MWSDPEVLDKWMDEFGWSLLTEETPPDSTSTTVVEPLVKIINGVPIKTWTVRDKTFSEIEAEVAAEAAAEHAQAVKDAIQTLPETVVRVNEIAPELTPEQEAVRGSLITGTMSDLGKIKLAIERLSTLLGDNLTVGSLRQWKTTVSNPPTAAQVKDLAELMITNTQVTRQIARQTLRLAKDVVKKYDSAYVGTEL